MEPSQLLQYVIRPVTKHLGYWSLESERLLLGTACQESHCGQYLVQLAGPAKGIYQSESLAMIDNLIFLERRPALKLKAKKYIVAPEPWQVMDLMDEIVWNLAAATIMCRVHYLRFPEPIPDNLPAQATYWKYFYNTAGGAGTEDDYIRSWHRFIGGAWVG